MMTLVNFLGYNGPYNGTIKFVIDILVGFFICLIAYDVCQRTNENRPVRLYTMTSLAVVAIVVLGGILYGKFMI